MKNWNKLFLVFGIWIEQTSAVLRGRCAECLSNSVACVDEESFVTCMNGSMTKSITHCPKDTVCTADRFICLPRSTGLPDSIGYGPVCYVEHCEPCSSIYGKFACLSETSYGFCYDRPCPDPSSIRICPNGRVCSLKSPAICVTNVPTSSTGEDENVIITTAISSSKNTEEPIESETTETVTEAETEKTEISTSSRRPIDPNAYCSMKNETGYFKDPDDVTCKEFFYCYLLSGQYLGIKYYCAGFFDVTTHHCETAKSSGC